MRMKAVKSGNDNLGEFFWPKGFEAHHMEFSLKRIRSLELVLSLMKKEKKEMRTAVQAGGSYGVWPRILAKKFDIVYTFEPEKISFYFLSMNCPEDNILAFQAALGFRRECQTVRRKSFTSHKCVGRGNVPVIRLDDWMLPRCDLVCLDVEGFEKEALKGMQKTIDVHRPVILVEDRADVAKFYGIKDGELEKFISTKLNCRLVAEKDKDKIFFPKG